MLKPGHQLKSFETKVYVEITTYETATVSSVYVLLVFKSSVLFYSPHPLSAGLPLSAATEEDNVVGISLIPR